MSSLASEPMRSRIVLKAMTTRGNQIMSVPSWFAEPSRVEEPRAAEDYAAVLSQVSLDGTPVIVRRDGKDLAAIVHPEDLELVRQCLGREEVEKLAAAIEWDRKRHLRPPQSWFDDEDDNPFEPQKDEAS